VFLTFSRLVYFAGIRKPGRGKDVIILTGET